jgi:hypothetical protein
MPSSKFLVHWTGNDKLEEKQKRNLSDDWLVQEYANRLKNYYQEGLYAERKKEKDVLPGIAMSNLVRICFTEIRLSQAEVHANRYGRLGIGFSRDFIANKCGRRVLYVPYEKAGGFLEQRIKFTWKKSKGNPELQKSLKWLFAFCKPMSNGKPEDSPDYINHYEEMEWRLVHGESLDLSGTFKSVGHRIHRVEFHPSDVKLIVLPDEQTKRLVLNDLEMKGFFGTHQPNLVVLDDCRHF